MSAITGSPLFFTQVSHRKFNPSGFETTEDCGPTCLAMVLEFLRLPGPARLPNGELILRIQQRIDAARFAMFCDCLGHPTDIRKAGFQNTVEGSCRYDPMARLTLTNLRDLERGAKNLRVPSFRVCSKKLWSCSAPLILAGDPSQPGAYGKRAKIEYQGGHFIFLPRGGQAKNWHTVFDPLCLKGPLRVSTSELKAFLSAEIFGED